MSDYRMDEVVDKLLSGMSSFLSTKTVVGEPIQYGETLLIPLVDVSFGMAAGTGSGDKKASGSGGIGGKMSPSAVLVMHKGQARLVNIKNQDSMTKILDMVPDVVNRFMEPKAGSSELSNESAVDIAFDRSENS